MADPAPAASSVPSGAAGAELPPLSDGEPAQAPSSSCLEGPAPLPQAASVIVRTRSASRCAYPSLNKVNRCLTEGRRAFLERVAGIEGGSECERLAPLVSLLADGELSADELRLLRPHLKSCLACRARLREYRAAPARVAALVPPVALAG